MGCFIAAASPEPWQSTVMAVSTAVTAGILLAAAIFAYQQARQTRLLREAQARPFVVVDFDAQSERPLIMLTIANRGSTLARDVTFEFDPPLVSSFDTQATADAPKIADLNIFKRGVPSLAPGKVVSILFDTALGRPSDEKPLVVRVRYKGEGRRTYAEDQVLDLSIYWGSTYVIRNDIHDVHERLQEIKRIMEGWRTGFGNGLLVLSPRHVRERQEQWRRRQDEMRAQQKERAQAEGRAEPEVNPPD